MIPKEDWCSGTKGCSINCDNIAQEGSSNLGKKGGDHCSCGSRIRFVIRFSDTNSLGKECKCVCRFLACTVRSFSQRCTKLLSAFSASCLSVRQGVSQPGQHSITIQRSCGIPDHGRDNRRRATTARLGRTTLITETLIHMFLSVLGKTPAKRRWHHMPESMHYAEGPGFCSSTKFADVSKPKSNASEGTEACAGVFQEQARDAQHC